jgi:hypothetical protein
MKRMAFTFGLFAASLVGLDLLGGVAGRASGVADRVVDIQHPTTLLAKLDRLRAAPHPKVVLIGDSLVYGGILEESGDAEWRSHELGSQLTAELGGETFVMNLGINGALPCDMERLIPLVAACDVDWIVLDVHLRPFSTDFSPADRQKSRPWLREMSADPDGRVRWTPADGGFLPGLSNVSALVRQRTLVQESLMSNRPVLRSKPPVSETDAEIQALVKLAQLKSRLKNLDLGPDGPQSAALRRLLADLSGRGQRHVVFYAKENPDLLPDVMDAEGHLRRFDQLTRLVRDSQGQVGRFVPPLSELRGEHFIDFTHLNAEGYHLLARRLAAEVR